MNPLTSSERVRRRIAGLPVDRVPNLNIVMAFAARHIGQPYGRFCKDHQILVEANLKTCAEFSIDMLSTISDPYRETSDFGADIRFPTDAVPVCDRPFLSAPGDIRKLSLFDPACTPRMKDRIMAIAAYRRAVRDTYPVLGWVEGAFAEACDLRGINEIMVDLYDDIGFVAEILDICCEQSIRCATEQIRAGADFIGIGDAAASLLSPMMYEEFVLPQERKLIRSIHENGAKARLHICGDTTRLLTLILDSGADIVDIDSMVDMRWAVELSDAHRVCINGNIDPVGVLLGGSAQDVEKAVRHCMLNAGRNAFVSAGCEVPRDTPSGNLKAMASALDSNEIKDIWHDVAPCNI